MLSEKDYAVVASMAKTGMELDVLKRCFPNFNEEDILHIYEEEHKHQE